MQVQDHKGSPCPEGLAERAASPLDAASAPWGASAGAPLEARGQFGDVYCSCQTAMPFKKILGFGFFCLFGFSNLGTFQKH